MGDRFWQVSPRGVQVDGRGRGRHLLGIRQYAVVLTYYWVRSRVTSLVGLFVFPFVLAFLLGRAVYASGTSTSSGALGRTPWGTQGLFQDARNKVFSVREEVRSTTRCCRRLFAFKGSVNSTQPASSEKQSFTRRQRGVKSESTKQATVTPQLFSLVCHWSVKVTSVPVARFLECGLSSVSSVVLTGNVWWHTGNVAR